MDKVDLYPEIDLQIALETLSRLEQESGDVGGLYWHKVAVILRQSDVNRRLLAKVQQKLSKIQGILEE
jgi:hypothetical protein